MGYPATLPKPVARGYMLKPVDPSLRTEMDVGAARVRRRTRARNDRLSLTWVLTDAQMAIYRAWFDSSAEADGGTAWVALALHIGDGGLSNVEFKFIGPYQASASGGLIWTVTADVEVRSA